MTNNVLLDNITHKDLKVIRRNGAEYGDNLGVVLTFPTEFGDIQREYPILLRKNQENDDYQFVALLGFQHDENLFLDEDGWNASYIPAVQSRGPFLIGFQEQVVDGIAQREQVVYVDMDNPRVSKTEGEDVFLKFGGNSPYLDHVTGVLKGIQEGMETSKILIANLIEFDLIEPVNMQIKINEDLVYNLNGFYTVNDQKLKNLDGESLFKLNSTGVLRGIFMVAASLSNLKKMIDMKNRQLIKQQMTESKKQVK